MTEPIKLPPCIPATSEARNYARLAVEQATAELRAEVERLRAANEATRNAGFVEASRIHGKEVERLRGALEYAVSQNEHDMLLTGEECRAARAALKEPK
jgi:F0F1-type ATP synthase membrane subunit b/b'